MAHASTILAPGEVTPAHHFTITACNATLMPGVYLHRRAPRVTRVWCIKRAKCSPLTVPPAREHRSDHQALTTIGDQFCVQCHADLRTKGGQAPQYATQIRGFDAGHPEFSVIVAGQNEQKSRVKL